MIGDEEGKREVPRYQKWAAVGVLGIVGAAFSAPLVYAAFLAIAGNVSDKPFPIFAFSVLAVLSAAFFGWAYKVASSGPNKPAFGDTFRLAFSLVMSLVLVSYFYLSERVDWVAVIGGIGLIAMLVGSTKIARRWRA